MRFSRRTMVSGALKGGAGLLGLFILGGGIPELSEKEEGPIQGYIDEPTRERLLSFDFQTVAHNGGEHDKWLDEYLYTGCDYIELDIRKNNQNGRLYIAHNEDDSRNGRKRDFASVARRVLDNGNKLFIDLKDTDSPLPVLDFLRASGVASSSIITSASWDGPRQIEELTGEDLPLPSFTIQKREHVDIFLRWEKFPQGPFGISLDKKAASERNIRRLKSAGASTIFVYTIESADRALQVLENGADGIITNNLTLLNVKPQVI